MSRELLSDSSTPTFMTFDIHGNHWWPRLEIEMPAAPRYSSQWCQLIEVMALSCSFAFSSQLTLTLTTQ